MSRKRSVMIFTAILAMAVIAAEGCGNRKKDEKDSSKDAFRVPDSLLADVETFKLVKDEYHPVTGGIMANKDIELHYPASQISRYIAVKNFGFIRSAYDLASEKIGRPADGPLVVIGAKDLDEYLFLTRKEWWYYGEIQGDTLYLEPLDIMLRRFDGVTNRTFAEIGTEQKIAQMALKRLSKDKMPLWMREGAASFLANEGAILNMQSYEFKNELLGFNPPVDELNEHLRLAMIKAETRVSFFISLIMVRNLLESASFEDIVSFAAGLGEGKTLDEASESAFGTAYGELVEKIRLKENFTSYLWKLPEEDTTGGKEKHHH